MTPFLPEDHMGYHTIFFENFENLNNKKFAKNQEGYLEGGYLAVMGGIFKALAIL